MKRIKRFAFFTIVILLICIFAFLLYASDYYHADDHALTAIKDETVYVNEDFIAFLPSEDQEEGKAGLIFYPGGKVEHSAYAPLMRSLAEKGILCIVMKMPFRLAVLDLNAADGLQEQFPQIANWYIGGHSLGGSMAASYVSDHSDAFEGLVLLASYSTASLSETNLKVISIYGTEDHVLNMEKYQANLINLPDDYAEYVISGGCHAYFGSYGIQAGDGIATISPEEQIQQTACLLADFIT